MKKVLLVLLACILPIIVEAQKKSKHEIRAEKINAICDSLKPYYTETESGIEFSRIIKAPLYESKEELYSKCLELMGTAYKNAKEVIQNKDKEQGIIFGKGVFIKENTTFTGINTIKKAEHTIKIEVREGRFKIVLSLDRINIKTYYPSLHSTKNNTYPIKSFYPFWKECPIKKVDESFDYIYYCFADAISILDYFENEINKPSNQSNDDW